MVPRFLRHCSPFPIVLTFLAFACGGAESEPAVKKKKKKPVAEDTVSALRVDGLLRLLPEDAGWYHVGAPKNRERVDRHKSVDLLVRHSFGKRVRESRRGVKLNVMAHDRWESPVVQIPRDARLCFSHKVHLKELGALLGGVSWHIDFEVPGASGRAASVEIWRRDELLRPPHGGTWRDVALDLSELAGKSGRFVFKIAPRKESLDLPEDLHGAIGNPQVVIDREDRPNLLVISVDTLRRDSISPYDAERDTPRMQALADRGVVFDNFWTTAPWTLPAYASLFTGEYPSTHGAGVDRSKSTDEKASQRRSGLASGIPSLVSHFADLGYHTQSIYANGHLGLSSGLGRGFDGYIHYAATGRMAAETFDGWVRGLADRPFFAFVQLIEPHWPYVVPNDFAGDVVMPDTEGNESLKAQPVAMLLEGVPEGDRQDMADIYDVLVRYMDGLIGSHLDVLEKHGLTENTLVVFHVDHGEELWDHGEWWHGHTHHRELTNVPLIFSWPGHIPEGTRVADTVRGVDVLHTALDLMGLPAPEHETEGQSVAYLVRGEPARAPLSALTESQLYGPGGDIALTEYPWRLIVQPRTIYNSRELVEEDPEAIKGQEIVYLFNLEDDPGETTNIAEQHADLVVEMRERAEAIQARALARKVGESPEVPEEFDDRDALHMLGYAE